MKISSLFSGGIDGMSLGFSMAGYGQLSKSVDIDQQAVDLLRENYSHEIIREDIRNLSWHEFEGDNVLAITAPCPEYSNARNIKSSRSKVTGKEKIQGKHLYLHAFRILALVQPEVYIAENVPEFLNYQIPSECFTELRPYDTYVISANTKDFNLPQERERLFFLGFRKKFPGVPDIFQHQIYGRQQKIKDIKELNPKFNIPEYVKNRIDGQYRDLPSVKTDNDIGNTCVAHYAKDRSTTLIFDDNGYKELRPFTPREYARLQGIPDEYKFLSASMTTKYRMIGNSVSPVICRAIALEIKKYLERMVLKSNG